MSIDLSANDKAVLNCIFNPSLPLAEAFQEEDVKELKDEEFPANVNWEKVKELEASAVGIAEKGNFEQAHRILTECIELLPGKASVFNNRAQVLQLSGKFSEAIEDLSKAISLSEEHNQMKTLCNALCQRGLLRRKFNQIDSAREDFERAASMGSIFAKNQLVEINPYAALCNQMLKKVLQEYR